jgi:hypothetical protein
MRVAVVLALWPTLAAAQGEERLLCETAAGETVRVNLSAPSRFDTPLHCVEAPGLRDLVAGCAPDGGWGLSAGDGSQDLAAVATESAGLAHDGGWFFARLGPSEFVASASVGSRPPLALEVAGETFWRMRLDLASGTGVVETRDGEATVACEADG